jgi:hypothetical protein
VGIKELAGIQTDWNPPVVMALAALLAWSVLDEPMPAPKVHLDNATFGLLGIQLKNAVQVRDVRVN